jgi:multidrug efflux pump subunit AcrB
MLADQSVFVRAAVSGVVREAGIAALLTALMILLFLGSWRSTVIIGVSIPLAILSSVIVLGLLHETINLMTLGGLALAVGILVDDATVTIENISRHLEEGQPLHQGILEGAAQIAVPALVSTLCICIVFLPMFALGGVAHYLFQPLAEAVIFAMLASYILSRTLVPTLAMYLLKPREENAPRSRNPLIRIQKAFDRGFEGFSAGIPTVADNVSGQTIPFCARLSFGLPFGCRAHPMAWSGLFPEHRQRPIHSSCSRQDRNAHRRHRDAVRPRSSAQSAARFPRPEVAILPTISASRTASSTICTTLPESSARRMPTSWSPLTPNTTPRPITSALRKMLPREFPGTTFYFLPADMTTQILDFGLPAPVDVQIEGQDLQANRAWRTPYAANSACRRLDRPAHSTGV